MYYSKIDYMRSLLKYYYQKYQIIITSAIIAVIAITAWESLHYIYKWIN